MKIPLLGLSLFLTTVVSAQERFTTQETVVETRPKPVATSAPKPPRTQSIKLRVGEVVEVFVFRDAFGVPREAFFVPYEGTRVVQVFKERKGNTDRYYLRGVAKGRTAGGVVLREWLDASGFKPGTPGGEMNIQAALKANPVFLTVE